jgi:surfeit locus 1 family protein
LSTEIAGQRECAIKADIVMPIKFRFRWIPFVTTVLAVVVGISLGQWQMRRAAEKEAIAQKISVRESATPILLDANTQTTNDMEYRHVIVRGEFVREWPVYLENRPHNGEAGFYVLMPLKIEASNMYVLIARGWVKRDITDRTKLPSIPVPAGIVEIEGMAKRNPGKLFQLGNAEPLRPNAIVQNMDIQTFAHAANMPMLPFLIEQSNDTNDGLVRDWPQPSFGMEKNLGYAFQWYALAATAFIFFLVTGFRRGRK